MCPMRNNFHSVSRYWLACLMRFLGLALSVAVGPILARPAPADSGVVQFERTTAYHNIRVVDRSGVRTLCFDDTWQTRMSLQNPLNGHFEYTEYFHMPFLWNARMTNVLMIGLGGASTQRSFQHFYPGLTVETVEIDPEVLQTAKDYFQFSESNTQKVHVADGRMYLKRDPAKHDLIILDAYLGGRYGLGIPQHLATKEFFELTRDHLTTNGVVAYNVIGTMNGWHANMIGAMYRTLKAVFPQVYFFPAKSSQNIVMIATKSAVPITLDVLRQRAAFHIQNGLITMPSFRERLESFQSWPPTSVSRSPILTDDYAPVEGLAGNVGGEDAPRGRK